MEKKSRNMPINIVDKSDKNADLHFWLGKSVEERISAVEFLREQYYAMSGYEEIPRFIPSVKIIERSK